MHGFASCDSTTCDDVFIDQSRNHSRRFCSAAVCGNRAAQRAYRVLMGTDYPFDMGPTDPLGFLADARLSDSDRNAIVGQNAARLLRIP